MLKLLLVIITCFVGTANAYQLTESELIGKLKHGGYNIFFRHAITGSNYNPPNERVSDCSSQRPLNDVGREQSKKIGEWFKKNQIPVDHVYSSPICRCKDTASLAFERFEEVDWLLASKKIKQYTLDKYLKTAPITDKNVIFIGHAITFSDNLLGESWPRTFLAEGEALIIDPRFPMIIGRIKF